MFDCSGPPKEFLLRRSSEGSESDRQLMALAEMFTQISTSIDRALHSYAERSDLTLLDGQALFAIIDLGNDARISTIAERLRVPLSTMTGVATRLVNGGLAVRKTAPDDGRSSILEITELGEERTTAMFEPVLRDVAEIMNSYGEDALSQVLNAFGLVQEMTQTLETRARGAGAF